MENARTGSKGSSYHRYHLDLLVLSREEGNIIPI